MAQIIIKASGPGDQDGREVLRERVGPADVETDTSSHLLVERIGWALSDADQIERDLSQRYSTQDERDYVHREGSIGDPAVG